VVVLVTQRDGLSTRDIFADFDAELTSRAGENSVAFDASLAGLTDGCVRVLANDLARPAFRRMPRLRDVLEAVGAAGLAAVGLTGSGPTVFGLARDPRLAGEAARLLRRRGWSVLVTGLRRMVPRVVRVRD
jgi:4-diphosphocytidyl-2C-methyl-D-erythritol kinase